MSAGLHIQQSSLPSRTIEQIGIHRNVVVEPGSTLHSCIRPRPFCQTCQVSDDLPHLEVLGKESGDRTMVVFSSAHFARYQRRTIISWLEIDLKQTRMRWHVR